MFFELSLYCFNIYFQCFIYVRVCVCVYVRGYGYPWRPEEHIKYLEVSGSVNHLACTGRAVSASKLGSSRRAVSILNH